MIRWMTLLIVVALTRVGMGAGEPLAWPQFRGPNGSGVADAQVPPVEVGPEKNVKWKVKAPSGASSPIVVGDDLLVLTAFDAGKLYTIAYRRADGTESWRAHAPAKQLEPYHAIEGSPAASTAVTDGQRIVSYFGSCGLFCYDTSGKELWRHELPPVATAGDFGTGVSPVIADGLVVLVRDETKNPEILGVDLETGKPRWQHKRQSFSAFCTPAVWDTPAGKQVVAAGYGRMIGYDLASGEERWTVPGMPAAACASPVTSDGTLYFAGWSPGDVEDKDFQMPKFDALLKGDTDGDGVLSKQESLGTFIKDFFDNNDPDKDGRITREEWDGIIKLMSNSKNSVFALKPGGTGDVSKSHVLWKKTKGMPYVATALVYRGQYVMIKDGGLVTAYDAKSGNEVYVQKRAAAPGRYYASPVAANGNIYFTTLDDGAITVLKAGADKPETVAENPPLGERISATPAIADNTLYVRTAGHLYAFAEKK